MRRDLACRTHPGSDPLLCRAMALTLRTALQRAARPMAASRLARRALCSSVNPRELELLQQVSRLESKLAEAEAQLPPRVQPQRITKWEDLTFGIQPTNGHVRHVWSSKTSAWDAGRFITDPYVNLHIHAGVLHYGMTLFEGCKAFRCKDGKIRVCNLNENSARMNTGAARLVMPPVPKQMFNDAVDWAVRANAEFVPPYGTGGSLYIRPFLLGSGPVHRVLLCLRVPSSRPWCCMSAFPLALASLLDFTWALPQPIFSSLTLALALALALALDLDLDLALTRAHVCALTLALALALALALRPRPPLWCSHALPQPWC